MRLRASVRRRVKAEIPIPWRTTDKLRVQIVYRYALQLQTPIGGVRREGVDTADGWIVRRPNGTYTGTMVGTLSADQQVRGSANCASTRLSARQQLHVEGRMLSAGAEPGTGAQGGQLGRTRDLGRYHWATPDLGNIATQGFVLGATWEQQPPADGYLVLEFFPKTVPATLAGVHEIAPDPDACLPLIEGTQEQRTHGAKYFIPFNDAQWTTPSAGYAIGLRRARDYYFVDDNNAVGYLGAIVSGGQFPRRSHPRLLGARRGRWVGPSRAGRYTCNGPRRPRERAAQPANL